MIDPDDSTPNGSSPQLSFQEFEQEVVQDEGYREWVHFPSSQQEKRYDFGNKEKKIYGFQIGINYICTKRALKGCINDALNLNTFLLSNGVQSDHLHYFSDFSLLKPSKLMLLKTLSETCRALPSFSSLFLSFSGHGTRIGQSHETICALSDGNTSIELILDTEIFETVAPILTQNPSSRLFFLADSCFSENVMKLKWTYLPTRTYTDLVTKRNEDAKETSAQLLLLSGSTKTQTSADVELKNGTSHGALTWCFLRFMQQNLLQKVTYRHLLLGINQELRKNHFTQTSCLSSSFALDLNQEFLFP
jgi:hypothetical protein